MTLQIIKSVEGKDEYVLLPMSIYNALHDEIREKMRKLPRMNEYLAFDPADYVDNPIASLALRRVLLKKNWLSVWASLRLI